MVLIIVAVMNGMFVSPPNSYAEALTPMATVFGGRTCEEVTKVK